MEVGGAYNVCFGVPAEDVELTAPDGSLVGEDAFGAFVLTPETGSGEYRITARAGSSAIDEVVTVVDATEPRLVVDPAAEIDPSVPLPGNQALELFLTGFEPDSVDVAVYEAGTNAPLGVVRVAVGDTGSARLSVEGDGEDRCVAFVADPSLAVTQTDPLTNEVSGESPLVHHQCFTP